VISFDTAVAESGATVIEATGRLDMVAAPQLKALVQSAIGEAKIPVVVELSQVQFMDSTGLGALISGLRATRQAGTVSLVLNGDAQQLEARFCDDGAAVEVDLGNAVLPDDLAESGRGLALVRMAVDEFSYRHSDGFSRWHLVRRRSVS
jgi:anti-sigma B factor antagonist